VAASNEWGDSLNVNEATQTARLLALECGLVPDDKTAAVARQLAKRIVKNGFRMATGFLGTKAILPMLSAHGYHDLACRLFQSRSFPSWAYEVELGPPASGSGGTASRRSTASRAPPARTTPR
jgi:alpha-L-rhamnosidase